MAKLFDGSNEWDIDMSREEADKVVRRDLTTALVAIVGQMPAPVADIFRTQIPSMAEQMHASLVSGILDGTVRLTADKHLAFQEVGRVSSYPPES